MQAPPPERLCQWSGEVTVGSASQFRQRENIAVIGGSRRDEAKVRGGRVGRSLAWDEKAESRKLRRSGRRAIHGSGWSLTPRDFVYFKGPRGTGLGISKVHGMSCYTSIP